jgi:hypothetical protein
MAAERNVPGSSGTNKRRTDPMQSLASGQQRGQQLVSASVKIRPTRGMTGRTAWRQSQTHLAPHQAANVTSAG